MLKVRPVEPSGFAFDASLPRMCGTGQLSRAVCMGEQLDGRRPADGC